MLQKFLYKFYLCMAVAYPWSIILFLIGREQDAPWSNISSLFLGLPGGVFYCFLGEIFFLLLLVVYFLNCFFGKLENQGKREETNLLAGVFFSLGAMLVVSVFFMGIAVDLSFSYEWGQHNSLIITSFYVTNFFWLNIFGAVFKGILCILACLRMVRAHDFLDHGRGQRLFYAEQFFISAFFIFLCVSNAFIVHSKVLIIFFVLGIIIITFFFFLARVRRTRYERNNFYKGVDSFADPAGKYRDCVHKLSFIIPTFITDDQRGAHFLVTLKAATIIEYDAASKIKNLRFEGYARGYKEGYEDYHGFSRPVPFSKEFHDKISLGLSYYRPLIDDVRGVSYGYQVYKTAYDKGYWAGYEASGRARWGNFRFEIKTFKFTLAHRNFYTE